MRKRFDIHFILLAVFLVFAVFVSLTFTQLGDIYLSPVKKGGEKLVEQVFVQQATNVDLSAYLELLEDSRIRTAIESHPYDLELGGYDDLLLQKISELETGETSSWSEHRHGGPWEDSELREVFLQKVALSLYVEVNEVVPWSILDYNQEDLNLLLGDDFEHYWFPSYAMFNNNPLMPYNYANSLEELYPDREIENGEDLLNSIVFRMREEGWMHISSSQNENELCAELGFWEGHYDFLCSQNVRLGGSGGTPRFINAVLQSYNVPSKQVFFRGHGGVIFPTAGLSMDGDDVYSPLKAGIILRPNYLPTQITFHDLQLFYLWNEQSNGGINSCDWSRKVNRKDIMEYLHLYCDDGWDQDINALYEITESSPYFPNSYNIHEEGDALIASFTFGLRPSNCQFNDPNSPHYYSDPITDYEMEFWLDLIGGERECPDWSPCYDGVDNDLDGLVDWPFDPNCLSMDGETEKGFCGDSWIEPDEQCDDGNTIDGDGCSNVCEVEDGWTCYSEPSICTQGSTLVFIEGAGRGDIGGLEGADQLCQHAADTAGLEGEYKAWLSDSTISASERFFHNEFSYQLLDGTVIANNWDDLTDGYLANEIIQRADGSYINPAENIRIWTGTGGNGEYMEDTCLDWTSSHSENYGDHGRLLPYFNDWTSSGEISCGLYGWLYCFEQGTICGNGIVEQGEECDGGDFGGASCVGEGFDGGSLGCNNCVLNTGLCTECGNGLCEAGETGGCGGNCRADCGELPACSLLPGTQISLADGRKINVEDLEVGDGLLGYDENSEKLMSVELTEKTTHPTKGYYVINDKLRITATNPIYVNSEWKFGGEIKKGDILLNSRGKREKVRKIEFVDLESEVYTLSVSGTRNFFADDYLVHNKPPKDIDDHLLEDSDVNRFENDATVQRESVLDRFLRTFGIIG